MSLKFYRSGVTTAYVGTLQFRPSFDKWWRVQTPVAGPLDLFGERLLPSSTVLATFAKAYKAGTVLTFGGEESPAFQLDTGYVGGNHLVPGSSQKSIFNYQIWFSLDGHVPALRKWLTGNILIITERYRVRRVVNGPAVVEITITRTWNSSHQMTFTYKAKTLLPFKLFWVSGLQSQRPNVKAGQTLWLRIPATISPYGDAGGTLATAISDLHFGSDKWANPTTAPIRFERFVKQGGAPLFTVVQGFSSGAQPRGEIDDAYWYTANKKSLPKGIVYPVGRTMAVGETYQINGYYGCYNSH